MIFFCLLIFIAFLVNFAVMISTSTNVERVTNTIISNDVAKIVSNSQISRDLSGVLAQTHYLISTFYGREEIFENNKEHLIRDIENILQKEMEATLKDSLQDFYTSLTTLLKQCTSVNKQYYAILDIDRTINELLGELEETVSLKIVNLVLAGEDYRALEQIGALIPSYRESLLQTILIFTRMSPTLKTGEDVSIIMDRLDTLQLRFRTLLASDSDVAEYGQKVLHNIKSYQHEINNFQIERSELTRLIDALDNHKHRSMAAIKSLEDKSANAAQQMNSEISKITDSSLGFVIIFSGTVAAILGVFTYFFLLWHIRRPMDLLRQGIISFSKGDLSTRIQLGRDDEWNIIEKALNRMASDLAESYHDLQKGNDELKMMYDKIERNVLALEEEILLREEAEEALQHSQEQYQRFFQDDLSAAMQFCLYPHVWLSRS